MKADYTICPVLKNGKTVELGLKECDRPTFIMISKVSSDPDPLRMIEVALTNLCVEGDFKSVVDDLKALKSCEAAIFEMITVEPVELKKN